MTTSRDAFLGRVRQAVAEGNRAGGTPPLPRAAASATRGPGRTPSPGCATNSPPPAGSLHVVEDEAKAVSWIRVLLEERNARRVLIGSGPYLDRLDLAARLAPLFAVQRVADLTPETSGRRSSRRTWAFRGSMPSSPRRGRSRWRRGATSRAR